MKTINIPLQATLEMNPKSFKDFPIQDPDELNHLIYELLEGQVWVKVPIGSNEIKAVIKYMVPNPIEINEARINHRDKK